MREQLESLRQECEKLQQSSILKVEVEQPVSPSKTLAAQSSDIWLTVKEAYEEATVRGFRKSLRTFRRALNEAITSGTMPQSLESLGLVADLDTRRNVNPKNNLVCWLRFEE